jgi:hypothetical protein
MIMTVFSASTYYGESLNQSGVLGIKESGEIQNRIFSRLKYLRRINVRFTNDIFSNNLMSKILPLIPLQSIIKNIQPHIVSPSQKRTHHNIRKSSLQLLLQYKIIS